MKKAWVGDKKSAFFDKNDENRKKSKKDLTKLLNVSIIKMVSNFILIGNECNRTGLR